MVCDLCGKHEASIFVQQIIDGKAKELYICGHCAKKYNLYADEKKMQVSLNAVFNNLSSRLHNKETDPADKRPLLCPACGTSLQQIKTEGAIGCPLCFFYFRDSVLERMRSANGEIFYLGKLPEKLETFSECTMPLQQLKHELEKAVECEDYELAAYFRDRIKEMEACS